MDLMLLDQLKSALNAKVSKRTFNWWQDVFKLFKKLKKDQFMIDAELTAWVFYHLEKENIDFSFYVNDYTNQFHHLYFELPNGKKYIAMSVNQDQSHCQFTFIVDLETESFQGVLCSATHKVTTSEKVTFINFFKKKFSQFSKQCSEELNLARQLLKEQAIVSPTTKDPVTSTESLSIPLLNEDQVLAYLFSQKESIPIRKGRKMSQYIIDAKQKVIGMTTDEAFTFLENAGIKHRVSMRDGNARVLTCDYNPERINLITENNVVVETKLG